MIKGRIGWGLATVGLAAVLGACGGGDDDAALEPGEVRQATTPVEAVVATAGPAYCQVLTELDDMRRRDAGNEEALGGLVRLANAVTAEGPADIAERFGRLGEALAGLEDVFSKYGYETDLDTVELTSEEEGALLLAGLALMGVESTLLEDMVVLIAECAGADIDRDALVEALAGVTPTSDPVEPGDAEGDPPSAPPDVVSTPLPGPFGSGSHGHVSFIIESATLSNLDFTQWGREGEVAPTDPTATNLFVSLAITNADPNDDVAVKPNALILLVDGVSVGSAEEVNIEDFGGGIASQSSVDREYAWALDGPVTTSQLAIRYADGTVPMTVAFDPEAAIEEPYPIEVAAPGSGSYVNGFACDIEYTVDLERAAYLLDMPADLDFSAAFMQNRAPAASRWLVLEGFVTSGPADCLSSQGSVTRENLRLLIDGRPIEPIVAPLATLFENESLPLELVWEVPRDAEELFFRAIGTNGDSVDIAIELPELPLVDGA